MSDGTAFAEATQTFTLVAVNDAPVGTDNTVTINQDTPYILTATDFGFSDVDSGDSLSAVTINTLPSSGALTLNGEAVYVGQAILIDDINAGYLVFTPDVNDSSLGFASFNFQVADQSNELDAISRTFTIAIDEVNTSSVTTLSRRDLSNEGFEANKKIEESFRLKALNENNKETSQKPYFKKMNGTDSQPGTADQLFFIASSKGLFKETSDIGKYNDGKQNIRLRSVLTPPDPFTDRQGHIDYQLPNDVFKGGLGAIKFIATKKDGSTLPAWIKFDSKTGKLIADVPKEMKESLEIKVEAIDSRGYKAETTFKIHPIPNKMSFIGKHALSSQFKTAFHLAR